MQEAHKVYILMGGSGSGKTRTGQYLKELGLPEMVSHTTRAIREGEVPGVTYHYVTKEEFDAVDKIEWTEYPKDSGRFYCLSKNEVEHKLAEYEKSFTITDVKGVHQLREQFPGQVVVIYIHTPLHVMEQRMRARGDSEEAIRERLWQVEATNELSNYVYADYIVENLDWEDTAKRIHDIVFAKDGSEIERKFLMKDLPDLTVLPRKEILQGYISYDPETRIRKEMLYGTAEVEEDRFYLTKKSDGDLVRKEKTEVIDQAKFNYYSCLVLNDFINKTRSFQLMGNQVAEIDIYHDQLEGLVVVEVEFLSEAEAKAFVPPHWFGEEITYDSKYKNKNLANALVSQA